MQLQFLIKKTCFTKLIRECPKYYEKFTKMSFKMHLFSNVAYWKVTPWTVESAVARCMSYPTWAKINFSFVYSPVGVQRYLSKQKKINLSLTKGVILILFNIECGEGQFEYFSRFTNHQPLAVQIGFIVVVVISIITFDLCKDMNN